MKNLVLLLQILLIGKLNEAANILAVLPTPARSHSLVLEALLHKLASRGHDVTYVSAAPLHWPAPRNDSEGKFTSITLEGGEVLLSKMGDIVGPTRSPLNEIINLWKIAPVICEKQLSSKSIQHLLTDKNIKFDLVIVEIFAFDCMIPFARYFNAPLVGFVSFWPPSWAHAMIGNPYQLSNNPHFFLPYTDKMNFYERLHNFAHTVVISALRRWYFLPHQDAVIKTVFGEDTPPLSELETDMAIIISNTHPIFNFPQSNSPTLIEVGGFHIKPAKKLPKDIKSFLDDAPNGVVIFSLGSLINSNNLPPERLHLLTATMAALPCKVLWRWDTADVPGLPPNVRVESWMPQRDILAHPNVKLLVTHGGLQSTQEAVLEGIPRIALPFFGDQHMNALRAVQERVALALDFYKINSKQLIDAIMEVLTDPRYQEDAKRLSKTYLDQPETPMERAIFWTEYVIRHKGADHLQNAAKHLTWYQLYLLDVVAVLLISIIIFILGTSALLRFLWTSMKNEVHKKKD